MNLSMSFISGISLGIEYIEPMPDQDINFACIVLDLLFIRLVLEIH